MKIGFFNLYKIYDNNRMFNPDIPSPNVTEHIPEDTFIDRRKFRTYEELYSYLKNMSDREYMDYLDAIKNFIESDKLYPFSAECFVDTIVNEIVGGN